MEDQERKVSQDTHEERKPHGFVATQSRLQAFLGKLKFFFQNPSYPRTVAMIAILIVAVTIPVTVGVLSQTTHLSNFAYQAPGGNCTPGAVPGTSPYCCGYNRCQQYQYNNCTKYTEIIQYNVSACGYKAPTPTPTPGIKPVTCPGGSTCTAPGTCRGLSGTIGQTCGGTLSTPLVCCTQPTPTPPPPTPVICSTLATGAQCMDSNQAVVNHGCANIYSTKVTDCTYKAQTCCLALPSPTPALPPGGIRCGPNNSGACYWHSVGGDEVTACSAHSESTMTTNNKNMACQNDDISTTVQLPTCENLVDTGGNETTTNTSSCDIDSQGYNNGENYRCCIPTATPQNLPQCSSFTGTSCEYGGCTNGAYSTPATCGSPYMQCCNAPTACGTGVTKGATCSNTNSCPNSTYHVGGGTCSGNALCCMPNSTTTPSVTPVSCPSGSACTSPSSCKLSQGTQGSYCGGGISTPEFCCNTGSGTTSGGGGDGGSGGSGGGSGSGGGGGSGGGPSCTPGQSTKFALDIKLPGIGTGQFENSSPKHPTKHASVAVYDNSGTLIFGSSHDFSQAFTHANGNGNLGSSQFDLATKLTCGNTYQVAIKIPGYVTVKKTITYGDDNQTIKIAESDLIPGDVVGSGTTNTITPDNNLAGDDIVDIADYNIFRQCHDDPGATFQFTNNTQQVTLSCTDLINLYDFQDGGVGTDSNGISEYADNYNLWLRGYIQYQGH